MEAADFITIGGRKVGPGEPTFIIAEAGSNHNRDLHTAESLIKAAARARADAIKFQLFTAEKLYPRNVGEVTLGENLVDLFQELQNCALPLEWVPWLKSQANDLGLEFLCTPFDEDSADFLAHAGVPAMKIASCELNHLPLLRHVARIGLPLICSTGLATIGNVEEAIHEIRAVNRGIDILLMHCVVAYPLPPEQANLSAIGTLFRAFGLPVGFSDHSVDCCDVPVCALQAGACAIEKHFTLDKRSSGPDHAFALEPHELEAMVRAIRVAEEMQPATPRGAGPPAHFEAMLGHGRKEIMPIEAPLFPNDKRSIHALEDIQTGGVLSTHNIRILRSERRIAPGLHPRYWDVVLGCTTTRDVSAGDGITWEHLLKKPASPGQDPSQSDADTDRIMRIVVRSLEPQ